MITISKCKKQGLEKQFKKLYNQMRENHKKFIPHDAKIETVFSEIYVEQALSDLGIDFYTVKGKKWYQFYKDEWEVKVYNSLRLISA
jgi:Holliday junction resolvasome RuvABC endonuclease subunit